MSYYICPKYSSSLDAGEHCGCGTRDKPAIAKDGYRTNVVIIDELYATPRNMLIMQKQCHEALHQNKRKEIFNNLCRRQEYQLKHSAEEM